MNAALLSQYVQDRENLVFQVLEALDVKNVSYNSAKGQFRFSREEGTNPSSVLLDCKSLRFYCFSTSQKGNLFTLVMDKLGCSFPESIRFVSSVLNLDPSAFSLRVSPPFHGFYKCLISNDEDVFDVPAIPEDALLPYLGNLSYQFLTDGIDYLTQESYQIGYDEYSHRITIPERNFNGELCGIMGRSNDPNCDHSERWFPLISCQRNKTLFGLHHNYKRIVESGTIVLFESEKAPMQCASFGCHVALGLCGCHISKAQRAMLLSMRPRRVILALDEGLEEEAVRHEAETLLQNNLILKLSKIGYVWDAEHDILPAGSKQNAADLGRSAYQQLMQTKVKWL